jgi:transcriptional regulator with XRE-family HTH domain
MQERIKEIRKHYKLTQTEFGERIGVKGNTITGYETGIRTPSDTIIE